MKTLIFTILIGGFVCSMAIAQSPWLSDGQTSLVSMEWDKPLFDNRLIDRDFVTGASSVLFLTGRVRVNDNFRVVGEIPFSHFGFEQNNPTIGGDDNSTVIGNIYVGGIYDINSKNTNSRFYVELGVRVPTTPEPRDDKKFGSITGLAAEGSDRVEAFIWDTWAIPLTGNFVVQSGGPVALKFRLGTIYDIYVDDLSFLENELYLLYGVTGLYRKSTVEAHLGFQGRNPYVGNNPDFFDDGFTQVRGGVAVPFGKVVPGVYVRKPLGENYNQLVDVAYGFSIEIRR